MSSHKPWHKPSPITVVANKNRKSFDRAVERLKAEGISGEVWHNGKITCLLTLGACRIKVVAYTDLHAGMDSIRFGASQRRNKTTVVLVNMGRVSEEAIYKMLRGLMQPKMLGNQVENSACESMLRAVQHAQKMRLFNFSTGFREAVEEEDWNKSIGG